MGRAEHDRDWIGPLDRHKHRRRSASHSPGPKVGEPAVRGHVRGWRAPLPEDAPCAVPASSNKDMVQRSMGPVYLRSHEHYFEHSRRVQHRHKTTFLRSWCPGLDGSSAPDMNYPSFLSELDVRLHNMHHTLASVKERSSFLVRRATAAAEMPTILQEMPTLYPWGAPMVQPKQPSGYADMDVSMASMASQDGSYEDSVGASASYGQPASAYGGHATKAGSRAPPDTISLRNQVNQNLNTQMEFYTDCMVRWCARRCTCKCVGCECSCKEASRILHNRAYGMHRQLPGGFQPQAGAQAWGQIQAGVQAHAGVQAGLQSQAGPGSVNKRKCSVCGGLQMAVPAAGVGQLRCNECGGLQGMQ